MTYAGVVHSSFVRQNVNEIQLNLNLGHKAYHHDTRILF